MDENDLELLNAMERPRVSEVLDYEHDLDPYDLVMLYAGIGSGKNTFAENLINGKEELRIPKKLVLLITSRKSKVLETLSDDKIDVSHVIGDGRTVEDVLCNTPFGLDPYTRYLDNDEWGEGTHIYQRSAVVTNAFIEKYHQYVYDPKDPRTHLWNRFDVIIVDEVHSLVTDSTYQSAPFYVKLLIQETVRRIRRDRKNVAKPQEQRDSNISKPICQQVIMMTGTPEAVKKFELFPELHLLDFRDKCRNVGPKNLHFIDKEMAEEMLREQLARGERVVYFSNHVVPVDTWATNYDIPREKVAMQFSDKERLKELEKQSEIQKKACNRKGEKCPETDYDKLMDVQTKLAQTYMIRDDIQLFVTTSKNKEGININNKDIHHVYIEDRSLTNIRQMAGRLREGVEHAYVIVDASDHNDYEHCMERPVAEMLCNLNVAWDPDDERCIHFGDEMLEAVCKRNGVHDLRSNRNSKHRAYDDEYPQVGQYIDFVTDKMKYLQYDYYRNKLRFNQLRVAGREFAKSERELFQAAMLSEEDLLRVFSPAFPGTHIHPPQSKELQARTYLEEAMRSHQDGLYTTEELDRIAQGLDVILNSKKKRAKRKNTVVQRNRVFHAMGYFCKRTYKKTKNNEKYDIWWLVPLRETVKSA